MHQARTLALPHTKSSTLGIHSSLAPMNAVAVAARNVLGSPDGPDDAGSSGCRVCSEACKRVNPRSRAPMRRKATHLLHRRQPNASHDAPITARLPVCVTRRRAMSRPLLASCAILGVASAFDPFPGLRFRVLAPLPAGVREVGVDSVRLAALCRRNSRLTTPGPAAVRLRLHRRRGPRHQCAVSL